MNIENYLIEKIIQNKKYLHPMLVAFDGVDTAGKTFIADKIDIALTKMNFQSIRVSIDKFHNSKNIRMKKGEFSPRGYFEDSFNLEKIIELIILPVKNNEKTIITGIYDYKIEESIDRREIELNSQSIILFDGIFMNRNELFKYWDFSVFLDVNFENVIKRAIKRDSKLFGNEEEIKFRYLNRYIPGQEIYLNECNPIERANIVIDNNDWNNPKLLKENFA